ncbi:hypothetical protein U9M48_038984 [Paspalum notatum var. saurae]|uniref:Peptidase A1 domain-containing protein n=1 Tax=Paspalum notatum var. saurae TaxID=547442 RepID=A0AAQ3UIL9_PASNO
MASRTALITSVLLLLLLVAPSSSLVTFDLHGNVHPVGFLYVTLKIGEPAWEYNLDVDTGSILTWVQCNVPNCRGDCKKVQRWKYIYDLLYRWPQTHPYYERTPAKLVSRNDPLCQVLHPLPGGEKQCPYHINYVMGDSRGLLIHDKFTLPSSQHTFAFGCGYDQTWGQHQPPVAVDGLLGLGRGSSVSLISQLKKEHAITKDVISQCISKGGGVFSTLGITSTPQAQ